MEHEVAHALEPQARIQIDGAQIGRTDVQPGDLAGAAVMSRKVADDVGRAAPRCRAALRCGYCFLSPAGTFKTPRRSWSRSMLTNSARKLP
jgi:hypothetical protein